MPLQRTSLFSLAFCLLAMQGTGCSGHTTTVTTQPVGPTTSHEHESTLDAATEIAVAVIEPDVQVVEDTATTPAVTEPTLAFVTEPGSAGDGKPPQPKPKAEGFPAISADGTTVAVTRLDNGVFGSSYMLAIELYDVRSLARRARIEIVNARDSVGLDADTLSAARMTAIRTQMTAAQTALAALHAHTLPAMLDAAGSSATPMGFDLSVEENELLVRRGDADGPIVLRRPAPARSSRVQICRGVGIQKVLGYYVLAPDRLLLSMTYEANDSCPGEPAFWQILAVPAASPMDAGTST